MMTWRVVPFTAMDLMDLHDALKLRAEVFVVEQNCVYTDVDGADPGALHALGHGDDGALVAYARILPPDVHGIPHIGRVVVRQDKRGAGLARELMLLAIEACREAHGTKLSAVEAQSHLEGFYASLGYLRQAPDHILDGIPHVNMLRQE